jgi:hypothetical protein
MKINELKISGQSKREIKYIAQQRTYHLHRSPDIFRVLKSRMLRWAGNVAWMVATRKAYRIPVGKPSGKSYMEDRERNGKKENEALEGRTT